MEVENICETQGIDIPYPALSIGGVFGWGRKEGDIMNAWANTAEAGNLDFPRKRTIRTTLYELIEAIEDEVKPGEEELVTATVLDLMESGKIKLRQRRKAFKSLH